MDIEGIGDPFTAISALFTGLAFVALLITIRLQQVDISLQLQEMKETRLELQRTSRAQEQAVELSALAAKVSALSVILSPSSGIKRQTIMYDDQKLEDFAKDDVVATFKRLDRIVLERIAKTSEALD